MAVVVKKELEDPSLGGGQPEVGIPSDSTAENRLHSPSKLREAPVSP